jgi:hypothetical protein
MRLSPGIHIIWMKKASFLGILESLKDSSAGLYRSKEGLKQIYRIVIKSGQLLLPISVRID